MLSAAASHVSSPSVSSLPTSINTFIDPPSQGVSPVLLPDCLPSHVANRSVPLTDKVADVAIPIPIDDSDNFLRHFSNVGKAAASARVSMASTASSHTEIIGSLTNARIALDLAIRDLVPGFPDRFDIVLTSDSAKRAIAPLIVAIKNYERALRHVESLQKRQCKPLSPGVAAVALLTGLAGSAVVLLTPNARTSSEDGDFSHPGVRLSAALLSYLPLLAVGIHYVRSRTQPINALREALNALRRELDAYAKANAGPIDSLGLHGALPPLGAARDAASQSLAKIAHTAVVHPMPTAEDTVVIDVPRNGSHFLM